MQNHFRNANETEVSAIKRKEKNVAPHIQQRSCKTIKKKKKDQGLSYRKQRPCLHYEGNHVLTSPNMENCFPAHINICAVLVHMLFSKNRKLIILSAVIRMVWTLSFVILMTMSVTISSINTYQPTDKIIALSAKNHIVTHEFLK